MGMEQDRLRAWYTRRKCWQKTLMALTVYLVGFGVIALAHALPFIRQGSYFIWSADAYTQHFPAFCTILDYLRDAFSGLLHGDFRPLQYSFSLGLGGDIWGTLNYYGLGNPFYLLGLLFPEHRLPLAFSLILEVQFLLGGVAFYAFARKLNARRWGAVAGAWLYVFSGFLPMSVQHPILAHAVFFLPLLLLGAEKVLRRENPLLLSITVFLMGLCGFYFLFISSVVLAFYVLLRSWQLKEDRTWWSSLWRAVVRCMAVYLAGLLASFVMFLPQMLAFFNSNRAGSGAVPALFGGFGVVKSWLQSAVMPGGDPFVGALGLLALVLALGGVTNRKNHAGVWAAGAAIGFVFVVSPFAQSALVGFGNSQYTRFWYALALLFAMALALNAERLFALNRWQLGLGCVLVLLAGLAGVRGPAFRMLTAAMAIVVLGQAAWWKSAAVRRWMQRAAVCALAVLTVLNLAWGLNAQAASLPEGSYRNERFARLMPAVTRDTLPEGEYRVDLGEVADHQWWAGGNAAMVGGYKGLSEYFSILNGAYTDAMLHDWALAPAQQGAFSFQGLDGCAALNTLAGVRYSFVRPGQEGYVPFGYAYVGNTPQAPCFTFVPDSGAELLRYENQYTLPLGYSYPAAMSGEDYRRLNGLQKQAAIMQLAAVEELPADAAAGTPDLSGVYPLSAQIQPGPGVTWQDGELVCDTGDGSSGLVTLTFDVPAESEVHLMLCGFAQQPGMSEAWASFTLEGGMTRRVRMSDAVDSRETWVNLGRADAGSRCAQMELPDGCRLNLREMQVWAYEMEQYARDAQVLAAGGLQNVVVGKNSIQGLYEGAEARMVVFSVPWSGGWSASVDGAPVPAFRANSMFTAVQVPAGSHAVRLYYTAPGFKAGAVCSALGILAILGCWVCWRRRSKMPAE